MKSKMPYFYYERSNQDIMPTYPHFLEKLGQIQDLCKISKDKMSRIKKYVYIPEVNCLECSGKNHYKLGNIIWDDTIDHKISSHQSYPSEYFVKVILNTNVMDNYILNPPIELKNSQINYFTYISLPHNKLLILDALMKQGSKPRYISNDKDKKLIYSEHSGVIDVKDNVVETIIVSANTDRRDIADNDIFLPNNPQKFKDFPYVFHTHPNTSKYGGRIIHGIVYEFPSSSDIFNFVKYYNNGKVQSSIIVSPEGIYVIRPIKWKGKLVINKQNNLGSFISELEEQAIEKIKPFESKISNPDIFHENVSYDLSFIKKYNQFIKSYNLFIEFYPREKKDNKWSLRPLALQYLRY